jgi:hypothetical protein
VNATGSALVYSALIGGAGSDYATGIAIDSLGSAYIAGYTSSVAFPVTSGGFQKSYGGGVQDAFVAKLNSSGSGLIYCTYLGGIGNDVANGIAVDAAGQAYVVGYTDSTDFPTRSPIYANSGGQGDGFVAKLTPAGDSLAFSTYLGGSLVDIATAVALDSTGNVYVTGTTLSANFPVTGGAFQTVNHGSYDAFISKMDSLGTTMLYSTYLGGEGSDQSSSIAVDANGVAYIAGFTYSYHFPLQGPIQPATHGGQEAFAAAVGSAGSSLVWSTYLGGAADDQATGVAVDALGDVYVVGSTFSSDFPVTSGAYRTVYSGGDGFVVKLGTPVPQAVSVTPSSGNGASQTFAFQFSDALGSRDIAVAGMLINGSLSSVQGCEVQYASAANQFTLLNDAGTGPVGVATPGSTTILWNSQCELSAAGSGTVQSGNSLTVTIQVRFSFGFTGSKTWWSQSRNNTGVASSWQLMGTWTVAITPGDFDGNGVTDLILQNDSTRAAGVWYLNGPDATDLLFIDYPAPGSYPGWTLVAVADMDGNGVPDLIWQNDVMRTVGVWYMGGPHGTNILYIDYPAPGAYLGWTLVSVHDMNGDGIPDLIWQNDSTREVGVWLLSGPTATSVLAFESVSSSNPGWTLVGVGDFDGNGVPDLVWQNDSTRAVQVWYMGGAQGMNVLSAAWLAPGSYLGWKVVAISDLDHNGVPDLVWQNDSTRSVGTWYMGGVKGATVLYFGSQATGNYPGWRAIGPK